MFDDYLVVYKCLGDLMFYVTGSENENELILYAVLQAFYEATSTLLRCALLEEHRGCFRNCDMQLCSLPIVTSAAKIHAAIHSADQP